MLLGPRTQPRKSRLRIQPRSIYSMRVRVTWFMSKWIREMIFKFRGVILFCISSSLNHPGKNSIRAGVTTRMFLSTSAASFRLDSFSVHISHRCGGLTGRCWRLSRSGRSSALRLKCYSHFSQPGILASRTSSRTPSGPLLGPHCTGANGYSLS